MIYCNQGLDNIPDVQEYGQMEDILANAIYSPAEIRNLLDLAVTLKNDLRNSGNAFVQNAILAYLLGVD